MSGAEIRFFEPGDIAAILEIQSHSREAAQWSRVAYENLGRAGEQAWVSERDSRVVGFLVARAMAAEMEILNLAVAENVRREGIGAELLREALRWSAQNQAERVFLEVRVSNIAARKFYEAHGFVSAGVRAKYYRDPSEDALLLTCMLEGK